MSAEINHLLISFVTFCDLCGQVIVEPITSFCGHFTYIKAL